MEPDVSNPNVIDSGWESPPGTSHLLRFRFVNHFFADDGKPSELWVVFKGFTPKTSRGKYKPPQLYVFEMVDHTTLATVFEAMRVASHPGEVVDRELTKNGIGFRGPFATE